MLHPNSGPGATERPNSSATMSRSARPDPEMLPPPRSSLTSSEVHPISAPRFHHERSSPATMSARRRISTVGVSASRKRRVVTWNSCWPSSRFRSTVPHDPAGRLGSTPPSHLAEVEVGSGDGGSVDLGRADRVTQLRVTEPHLQRLAPGHVERLPDGLHRPLYGGRGFVGDDRRQLSWALSQSLSRVTTSETRLVWRPRWADMRSSRPSRAIQNLAQRNPPGQADRFESRGHPVGDVRVEEGRILGAYDYVRLVDPVEGPSPAMPCTAQIIGFHTSLALGLSFFPRIDRASKCWSRSPPPA